MLAVSGRSCRTPGPTLQIRRLPVRLRLRAALWRQWKTPRRRRAALIALGVRGELRNMAGAFISRPSRFVNPTLPLRRQLPEPIGGGAL
jgi:hypothetical protein